MLLRATESYGRVLRSARFTGLQQAPWIARIDLLSAVGGVIMQLRTRSSGALTPKVEPTVAVAVDASVKTTVKRTRRAAASPTIKEEVRGIEFVEARVTSKRSPRKKIKSEAVVKADISYDESDCEAADGRKSKTKRIRRVKRGEDGKPEQWEEVLRGIQEMRALKVADVDVAGVEVMFDDGAFEPHVARFHVLISAMLSSQTKDPVNAAAMKRLIPRGLTVQDMLDIDEKELAQLIYPVGFYNNKARYIKQVAQILTDKAAATGSEIVDIPNTFGELVALPGVGPKMAHLVMSCAWDTTVGICVDTHVHRISNRLGWVKTWNKTNPKSQDPEKTRKELEEWLPREHWHPINVTLVGFGQTVCFPRGPKCSECTISHICPSAFSSAI